MQNIKKLEKATFGAGCFWHVEEVFRNIKGVVNTSVGFMGGNTEDATYEDVSHSKTGHAEVLHLEYDPVVVSYKELLAIFWENHDPTTLNRQGADVGNQYRSIIFFHTPEQEEDAIKSKEVMDKSGKFKSPIVTEIILAGKFYKAEESHQKYLQKRGLETCSIGH